MPQQRKINKDPLFSSLCSRPSSEVLLPKCKPSQIQSVYEFGPRIPQLNQPWCFWCLIWKAVLLSHSPALSSEVDQMQNPDIFYNGKAPLPFDSLKGEERGGEKHANNNNRAEIKSYLLASKLGWNSEEEVSEDLNSFQLWARWWCTEDCSKQRWWGLASSTRSVCLDTWYLTFKPNFLRPQFVQKEFHMWKTRDPFGQGLFRCDAQGHTTDEP